MTVQRQVGRSYLLDTHPQRHCPGWRDRLERHPADRLDLEPQQGNGRIPRLPRRWSRIGRTLKLCAQAAFQATVLRAAATPADLAPGGRRRAGRAGCSSHRTGVSSLRNRLRGKLGGIVDCFNVVGDPPDPIDLLVGDVLIGEMPGITVNQAHVFADEGVLMVAL